MSQIDHSSIVMPEVVIFRTVKAALETLRVDFDDNSADETKSLLYKILRGTNQVQRYNMFEQAKDLFITPVNPNEPKYIDVSIGFDKDRIQRKMPGIHLFMRDDSPQDDTLGQGYGNVGVDFFDDVNQLGQRYHQQGFQQRCDFIITTENYMETTLIWTVLRSLLVAYGLFLNQLGLREPKFNGGDVQPFKEVFGERMYIRNLTMKFNYYMNVPEITDFNYITDIYYSIEPYVKDE